MLGSSGRLGFANELITLGDLETEIGAYTEATARLEEASQ